MARDPVCGMEIDESTAEELGAEVVEHRSRRWYFCSPHCRDAFLRSPDRYAPPGQEGEPGGEEPRGGS